MAGDYPDIPFVQAAGDGGPRSQTQMVVIHATDNTASDEAEASYASHRPDQISAHFYNDTDSVIQAVPLSHVAYGCYPTGNSRSVQFELVGLSNRLSDATLRRIAPIVRRVCDRYGIPIRHVGPAELRAGVKGICGHGDVTLAWNQGTHTDPGASFPWSTFISYVNATPTTPTGDDMTPLEAAQLNNAEQYAKALVEWSDQTEPISNTSTSTRKPNNLKAVFAALAADVTAIKNRPQVTVDAGAVAAALAANPAFLAGVAKAVNDDAASRMAQ